MFYQYAKIVSESAEFGKKNYGMIMFTYKKLCNGEIVLSTSVREWLKERKMRGKMDIKTKIDELRQSNIERYLRNDFELLRDLDIEKHDIEGYHGREILELLQNVDDACERNKEYDIAFQKVIASISFSDGVLTVSNTGTKFDYEGIKALAIGHISTKDDYAIGSKGSGFRGVLNWSDSIRIFSGNYKVGFSKEYTKEIYQSNSLNGNIKRQAEKYQKKEKKEICFPMLSMPKYLEDNREESYDTIIEIDIDQEKNTGDYCLEKQFKDFDYRVLLFLPNLTQIDITIDGRKKTFLKENVTENGLDYVELRVVEDCAICQEESQGNERSASETYIIKKQKLDDLDGNKYLLIAVPLEEMETYPIYCYFPTQEVAPFPVLMHAPFILSGDRNHIPTENNGFNKKLFEQLIALLTDIANRIVKLGISRSKAVEIVTPDNISDSAAWNFSGAFSRFNLQQHYFSAVKDLRIFPTVNGDYTTICDGVKRLKQQAPLAFKGKEFELLLEYFSYEANDTLVSAIAKNNNIKIEYSDDELCERINALLLNTQECIEIFLWWNEHRKYSSVIPNVLKDTNSNVINTITQRCFLPTETGINDVPSELAFVNLTVLHKEYMDELVKQIQEKDESGWQKIKDRYMQAASARILAAYSDSKFVLKFTEQGSKDVIVREINNQIKTNDQAVVYYKWLFELYNNKEGVEAYNFERIDYMLPSFTNAKPVSKLFFGKEWDNSLGERIFFITKDCNIDKLASPDYIGITATEQSLHKQFLIKLGVKEFPLIKKEFLNWRSISNLNGFNNYIKERYPIDFNINYMDIYTIYGINEIINGMSMEEIVEWVKKDSKLHSHLLSIENGSNVRQQNNWTGVHFPTREYLVWVLNTAPWLKFDDKNYMPKQIVVYSKLGGRYKGLFGIEEKELISIVGDTLYSALDFNKSLGELDSKQIKGLLLELSETKNGEISRKLYEEVIKHKGNEEPDYSTNDIKVLCKDGEFRNAKKVSYAHIKLPKSISEKAKLIWINEKRNTNTISKWFGVERYETSLQYESSEESAMSKDAFKKEIDELKIVVLSTIEMTKENISKIKRLSIEPRSNIKAKDSEQDDAIVALDDYNYIESTEGKSGTFYINIPKSQTDVKELLKNDAFASEISNIFKEALNLNVNESLIELLIGRTTDARKLKIAEEYAVDRWNEAYEAIFEKTFISRKVDDFLSENGVSSEYRVKIAEIDFSYQLSDTETALLIDVFVQNKIALNDFIEKTTIDIDVRPYLIRKISRYCELNAGKYAESLYNELLSQDISAQECFEQRKIEYESFVPDIDLISNSEIFCVQSFVESRFGVFECVADAVVIDEVYIRNFNILSSEVEDKQKFNDFIDTNRKLKSLIYFLSQSNNYRALIVDEYKKYIETLTDWQGLVDGDGNETKGEGSISSKRVEPNPNGMNPDVSQGGRHARPQTATQHSDANKGKQGNGKSAERIAYKLLKKEFHSLKWTSENADIGLPERNTSRVFDMYYIDGERKVYVEIKALSSEFYMSRAEYDFAIDQGENHVIYFVDIEKEEVLQPAHLKDFEPYKEASEYKFKIITNDIKTE